MKAGVQRIMDRGIPGESPMPIAFLVKGSKVNVTALPSQTADTLRDVITNGLPKMVARDQLDALGLVLNVWAASMESGLAPSVAPDRQDTVIVFAFSRSIAAAETATITRDGENRLRLGSWGPWPPLDGLIGEALGRAFGLTTNH